MKQRFTLSCITIVCAVSILFSTGCFKDTATKTYKVYRPVLATTAEVRAAVKSDAPQSLNTIGKMVILGSTIFLNESGKGIHIIDNNNPAKPVNKGFINIPGNENLAVKDNILYADCYTDLLAIDISNPSAVLLKSYVANLFPERRYLNGYTVDTGKVVTGWIEKDTVIDISIDEGQYIGISGGFITYNAMSLANMSSSAGKGTGVTGSTSKFAIIDNFLYAVTSNYLNTVNITQASMPQYTGKKSLNATIETIYPFNDKLFIGSQTGMFIYSVSNPLSPVYINQFQHARLCDPVIGDSSCAYVTLHSTTTGICQGFSNQLDVVNIHNLSQPVLIKTYNLTSPKGLSKDGNTLFICDGDELKVFNASVASNVTLKQTISLAGTLDVIAFNGIAYVVAKGGLYQYSYDNYHATPLSKITLANR